MIHRFIIINELGIRQIDSQLTRSHLELQTIALLRLSFVVNIGLRVSICCTILSFNDKSRVNIANVQWIRIAHHRQIINRVNYIFYFNCVLIFNALHIRIPYYLVREMKKKIFREIVLLATIRRSLKSYHLRWNLFETYLSVLWFCHRWSFISQPIIYFIFFAH